MQKARNVFRILRSLLFAFILLAGLRPGAAGAQPLMQTPTGTAFTYQGQLNKMGQPYNGTCSFTFGLFGAATGGTQYGASQVVTGVSVTGGVFSVTLNEANQFQSDAFPGDPRWLNIQVQCEGDKDVVSLGRQMLTGAPYALGVVPSAGDSVVNAINNSVTGGQIIPERLTDRVFRADLPTYSSGDIGYNPASVLPAFRLKSGSPAGDRFVIQSDGSFYARTLLGVGKIPVEGQGDRLMWHSYKAAFRAGSLNNQHPEYWDDANIGYYSWAGGLNSKSSGNFAFAFGNGSDASGSAAVALGSGTLASGDDSVALGYKASTNAKNGAFVFSDVSTTTVFNATADHQFSVRASGGVRLRTNSSLSTGCDLAAGGGTWDCTSDRSVKENFSSVDGEAVLEKLAEIPVQAWNFKDDAQKYRHIGPMAQDFYAAFGLGTGDKTISSVDMDGVNLAAIQALEARTQQISALKNENAELRGRLDALEARLTALEQKQAAPVNQAAPEGRAEAVELLPWAGMALLAFAAGWIGLRRRASERR